MSGSDVLHTAPAWTMGHRSSPHICSNDTGPGPGTYNPGVSLMTGLQCLKGRAAGFGMSVRLASYANSNPGAGDYDIDGGIRATRRRAASAGIRGRQSHDPLRPQQPGPGHYDIPAPAATRPQPPAASISQRLPCSRETERRPSPGDYDPSAFRAKSPLPVTLQHKRAVSAGDRPDSGHAVPGPGSYRPQDVLVNSRCSPAHSLAGRRRPASTSALLPGPADYSPYLPAPTPAVSFSRAERQPPCHYEVRPSPGSYFSSSVVRRQAGFSPESLRRSPPSFTISCRSGTAFSSGSPGPGDFSPRDSQVRRSSPVFTIKGVTRQEHCVRSPSPDAYCPLSCVEADSRHACAPSISISQRQPPPQSFEHRPAPGDYEAPAPRSKGLPVSMKFRHPPRVDRATVSPGPGECIQ